MLFYLIELMDGCRLKNESNRCDLTSSFFVPQETNFRFGVEHRLPLKDSDSANL